MTIYDIAKEAGVSASSVSRVINNKPGVNAKTRNQIQNLLDKYNFTANETARGLVNQSSKMIGVLVTDLRTMHYTDGAHYIEQELTALDYCCILFNTGTNDEDKCRYITILEKRRVDGVVLIGSSFQTKTVQKAIEQHLRDIPIVMINGYLDLPNVYGVLADEKQGIQHCVELLAQRGHFKNAYVLDSHNPSGRLKLEGFFDGMGAIGQEKLHWIYETPSTLDGGYDTTKRILQEHPDVEGIVFSIDLTAVGGVRALTDAGISIPRDVAVIGVDNSLYGQISNPRLTSLDNNLLDSSVAGGKILIDCLEGKKTTKKIMLFSNIVERETT